MILIVFVTEPPSIAQGGKGVVVPGCPACKKKLYTMTQYSEHLIEAMWKTGGGNYTYKMDMLIIGCLLVVLLAFILLSLRQCVKELQNLVYVLDASATLSKDRLKEMHGQLEKVADELREIKIKI